MSKALVPRETKSVGFYGDEVTAVRMEDGAVYVPIRPLCDHLGIDWSSQLQRINRDAVLSDEIQGVVVTTTPSPDGRGGGSQEMACLPLDFINGWLFGINAKRVKAEVRERLIRYQRECYRVLAEAFQGTAVVANAPSTLVQVYERGLAIAAMAKGQMVFDRRLDAAEEKLVVVDELAERVTAVEEKLSPAAYVNQEQASQISQAVKAVAIALGKKTSRNEFGSVYGELYRRYGLTSYKLLPARQFEDAMTFLTEWHQGVITDTAF
jgi:hypothetical protein